jgi:type IV pilus assembly protein PilX
VKNLKLQQLDKQQGAVLVMALVMLTVLTLIGVSSMSSSTLELKVAGNTQQHDIAFQAAQSIIDIAASEDPANTNNYQVFKTDSAQPGFKQMINYASSDGEATAQAETFWVGCKKNIGNSLEEGKAPASNFFNVTATGQTITGSSSSVQVQGLRYPAAACAIDL